MTLKTYSSRKAFYLDLFMQQKYSMTKRAFVVIALLLLVISHMALHSANQWLSVEALLHFSAFSVITNALEVFELAPENPVNCLHVAAANYDEQVLRKVLVNLSSQSMDSNEMEYSLEESTDNFGKTPLDYAIAAKKPGNVFILASAGSPHTIMPQQFHMEVALSKGKKIFMDTRAEFIRALATAQPGVPMEICLDIIRQLSGPDIAFTKREICTCKSPRIHCF